MQQWNTSANKMLNEPESCYTNDDPNISTITPVNKPKYIPDKITNNLDNFNINMYQEDSAASGQYLAEDYGNFDRISNGAPTKPNQFKPYSLSPHNQPYLPLHNHQFYNENLVQQSHPTFNATEKVQSHNNPHNFQQNSEILNRDCDQGNASEVLDFVPQESMNTFKKRLENECKDFKVPDSLNNTSTPAKSCLSDSKRKNLEKTVRLIENVIVKSTNNNPDDTHDLQRDPLAFSPLNQCKIENPIDYDIIKDENHKRLTDSDDEVLIKKVSNTRKKRKLLKEGSKIVGSMLEELPKESEKEDVKVKIEKFSQIDMDFNYPFQRDCNGVPKHGIGSFKIIRSENSVEEAWATIKNASTSLAYFECPHCSLLLIHPKRFLIHVKWHTFGLTNKKREEKLREKEAKALEKKLKMKEIKQDHPQFPCKDCDMVFSRNSQLKYHRTRAHDNMQVECRLCFAIVNRADLRAHQQTHITADHGYFQCPTCPKRFMHRHSLTKHAYTHLEKSHSCPECNKKFGSEGLLKTHLKTHQRRARGTTHHCSYCGKGFYEAYNLNIHERTHRNDKPFVCETCQSCFVTNASLKRHIKVSHNTSVKKPFTCDICKKCFATEVIRDRHALRAHADKETFPYACNMCDKRYMKDKDLKQHVYKTHPRKTQNI